MTAPRPPSISDFEHARIIVSRLRVDEIHNALENLSGPGAQEEFGPEFILMVRGMLLRRLDSFNRGRRGLVSVPPPEAS